MQNRYLHPFLKSAFGILNSLATNHWSPLWSTLPSRPRQFLPASARTLQASRSARQRLAGGRAAALDRENASCADSGFRRAGLRPPRRARHVRRFWRRELARSGGPLPAAQRALFRWLSVPRFAAAAVRWIVLMTPG